VKLAKCRKLLYCETNPETNGEYAVATITAIDALLRKREIKKAEIQIARALSKPATGGEYAALLTMRARAKLYTGRPEGALDDLMRAYEMAPSLKSDPVWNELLADSHLARYEISAVGFAERADAQQAEALYREIISTFPTYENLGWINYQLARVLLVTNRVSEALEGFQRALLTPSTVAALTSYCYERLGFVAFYEQRDAQQALTFIEKAVQTYPASEERGWLVQAYLLRGRILRDTHKLKAAIQAAEAAISIALSARSESRQIQREALFTAAEILSRARGTEQRVIEVIEQFFQQSRKPQTIDVTWSRAYEMLADAYAQLGKHERSITAYLASLQFNPYHPWEVSIYVKIAKCSYQLGEYERTVQAVRRALDVAKAEAQPVDFQVYDLLGSAYYALGQYEHAISAFDDALKCAPAADSSLAKIRQYRAYAVSRLPHDPVIG
jgi:tetratricopeptide (TPR) repeat protein